MISSIISLPSSSLSGFRTHTVARRAADAEKLRLDVGVIENVLPLPARNLELAGGVEGLPLSAVDGTRNSRGAAELCASDVVEYEARFARRRNDLAIEGAFAHRRDVIV